MVCVNERIKELAEQAGLNATLLFNKEKLEKFAELIIEKFAYELMDLHGSSPEHIIYAAKQYGVEL
jgi:hypothetical protein